MAGDLLKLSLGNTDGEGSGHIGASPVGLGESKGPQGPMGVWMRVSHEIRTPLNSILALSQLLRDGMAGRLNPEQQRYVEVIERNGRNLMILVSDVLDLSRMEGGHIDVEIRTLDLGDQLRATVSALAALAEVKRIVLCVTAVDDLPAVRCDPDRLRQILTNLIGNAIKFTDRGQVVLSAEVREAVVAVHVSDTGVGIPEAARSHLFEDFFQADAMDARRRQGAGLGLAIASRFVHLMGGEISVESTEGVGSRFTFTVPRGDNGHRGMDKLTPALGGDRAGDLDGSTQAGETTDAGVRAGHWSRDERYGTNTTGR